MGDDLELLIALAGLAGHLGGGGQVPEAASYAGCTWDATENMHGEAANGACNLIAQCLVSCCGSLS